MAKCTKAAKIRRVDIVYRLLLLGLDTPQIVQHIASKYPSWGVKERAIASYIHDAKELLIRAGDYERHMERGRAMARLHDLYARCVQGKRYRDALAVQTEINKLAGLNEPVRIQVTEILALVDSEIAEREQELADLERQYAIPAADRSGD